MWPCDVSVMRTAHEPSRIPKDTRPILNPQVSAGLGQNAWGLWALSARLSMKGEPCATQSIFRVPFTTNSQHYVFSRRSRDALRFLLSVCALFSPRRSGFDRRPVHVDEVTLGQAPLPMLRFPPIIFIAQIIRTQRHAISATVSINEGI